MTTGCLCKAGHDSDGYCLECDTHVDAHSCSANADAFGCCEVCGDLIYDSAAYCEAHGIHRIGDIETARQNEYQYAYVQVGEEWQDFELEKHTDYSRTQYKLYLIDGSIMLVQKNRCILHNGKSLEELLKQFEEG